MRKRAAETLLALRRLKHPPRFAGSGCLGCLTNKDWIVRKRAAETLLALRRLLGPDIERGCADRTRVARCLDHLKAVKHDRVKPARESMGHCFTAFEDLVAWMQRNPVRLLLLPFYVYVASMQRNPVRSACVVGPLLHRVRGPSGLDAAHPGALCVCCYSRHLN